MLAMAKEAENKKLENLLTTVEVAELFALKPNSLVRMRMEGSGPRFVKLGSGPRAKVRYRRSDVLEFLDANTRTNTSYMGDGI